MLPLDSQFMRLLSLTCQYAEGQSAGSQSHLYLEVVRLLFLGRFSQLLSLQGIVAPELERYRFRGSLLLFPDCLFLPFSVLIPRSGVEAFHARLHLLLHFCNLQSLLDSPGGIQLVRKSVCALPVPVAPEIFCVACNIP